MHQLLLAPSFHYFLCSFSWLLSHRASVHWEKMDLIKERKKLDFLGVCIFYVENQTWNGFGETHWAFRQGHTCKRWFSLKKKKKISSSLTLKTPNKNVPEVCFRVLNCTCKTKAFFNSGKHFAWKILICALPIMPFLISPDFPTFLTRQKAAALPVPGDLLPRANVNSGTDMFST